LFESKYNYLCGSFGTNTLTDMSDTIRLKAGFDLPISGEAARTISRTVFPDLVSVKPTDFKGIIPHLLAEEGDAVNAGSPLFCDKLHPDMLFLSPESGTVESIERGDKRKILAIRVKCDGKKEAVHFDVPHLIDSGKKEVTETLLKGGLWPAIIQRPYGIIADPADTPRSIFISSFDSAPLAADWNFTLKDDVRYIQTAIDALGKLTKGGIHVCLRPGAFAEAGFHKLSGVIFHEVEGPHPAGNVGVQINNISPMAKGEKVWTVSMMLLPAIGKLFEKGVYDTSRLVAITGPKTNDSSYVRAMQGLSMKEISEYFDKSEAGVDLRIVSGNVLTGENVGEQGYLGFYDDEVTVLEEGNYREQFGWIKPFRLEKYSHSHTYLSFLLKRRKFNMDTNTNGGERTFVCNDIYSKVLPMDIYPVYLFKACIAGDVDKMEQLGIYEVIPEDVALCEYVDPSKNPIQQIVQNGIDLMIKEM